MEHEFWHERWQKHEIGFHRDRPHDLLAKYWPALGLQRDASVFVPLCGKSLDMVWLARAGHKVIGAELSPLAVDAFFAEQQLVPVERTAGSFVVKSAGPYELWLGDVFELPAESTADVAATYDRAALIAFPPEMQPRYADKIADLHPAAAPMLLITLEFDQSDLPGPPFSTPGAQVSSIYGGRFDVTELESREAADIGLAKRGLKAAREFIYRLQRRDGA